ncbi:primosomal protein [Microbacterium sp. NPDC079995]|uniref:primosomal protein n=2 Tax=unclassified Microbacterium TaxID=2609290 RepID=UPI00344DB002
MTDEERPGRSGGKRKFTPASSRSRDERPRRSGGESTDRDRRTFGHRDGERRPGAQRDGERRPYEKRDGERSSYPKRDGERRPYEKRDGERRPYEKRDGERRPYEKRDGERPSYPKRDGERRPYEKRDGERSAYPKRDGERRPYEKRDGERRPYEKRDGERPSYPKRDGERRPYEKRGGERSAYPKRDGERRPYEKRDGERSSYPKRDGERRPYEKRDGERSSYPRRDGERRPYEKRDGERRPYEKRDGERRNSRPPQGSDRRSVPAGPVVPDEISARDLNGAARNELKTLSKDNAEQVARHLAMAARLIDEDPALAHEHALAASRSAGRIAVVRETVAITAYAVGDFALALRELRTFRRISGRDDQIALMVDSERGVGRPDRALEVGRAVDRSSLPTDVRVELAIAMSGARLDLGETERALQELDIPELDPDTAYPWSPGLFAARSAVLEELGRTDEAAQWQHRADVAAAALGEIDADAETIEVDEIDEIEIDDPADDGTADSTDDEESVPEDGAGERA